MNTETRIANRRAAWRWGTLIVSLLGLQVIGGIVAIILATSDESVAVVPDYHQKALRWDEEVALRAESLSLGWHCEISALEESGNSSGLAIALTDARGGEIDLVAGELELYRHARAADVRRVRIPAGPFRGLELGRCFDADGRWQVSIDVLDRDGNRFTHSRELVLGATNRHRAVPSPQGDS